jgi:hypothetical protein
MKEFTLHRRHFVASTLAGGALAGVIGPGLPSAWAQTESADDELRRLSTQHDARVTTLLARQERRSGHPGLGGTTNAGGIYTAQGAADIASALAAAACAPSLAHRRNASVAQALELAVQHLLTVQQRSDGTIDLPSTNFHSTPDLGFIVERLAPACQLLRRDGGPLFAAAAEGLGIFVRRAGEALIRGGVHTPNHRWVVCAALAWVNALFPDPRLVARADQWLAEGIDIDPDGQYTEKSTAIYSAVVNDALLTVARLLNRPALRDPVRRNLEMTTYYTHPDGEVVTEASRRQDRATRGNLERYYDAYRTLALADGNGRFAAMCRLIERTTAPRHPGNLTHFLLDPGFARALPALTPLPEDYARVFAHSGLARIRRGARSATVLAGNSTFFAWRRGGAVIEAVRLASAFFGKGQFEGQALEMEDGRYRLRQRLQGVYYQPLTPEQIAMGGRVEMTPSGLLSFDGQRRQRALSEVQTLDTEITLVEVGAGFELRVAASGTDRVPLTLELGLRPGGVLEGVRAAPNTDDVYFLEGEKGRYRVGADVVEFGPGRAEHRVAQIRGALPKWPGPSVYLTAFTPCEFSLRFV